MAFKYRVHVLESERGWGSETWTRDFDTREEAQKFWDDLEKEYGGRSVVPDFYMVPKKLEIVEV